MSTNKYYISDELLAAFLEGNTTAEETVKVLDAIKHDPVLQEIVEVSAKVDQEMLFLEKSEAKQDESSHKEAKTVSIEIPMLRRAADNEIDNMCVIRCEDYILRNLGAEVSVDELKQLAENKGWMKEDGMPLHTLGRLSTEKGFWVTRRYDCNLEDIVKALGHGIQPLIVVDGGELTGDLVEEAIEDAEVGLLPDHAVVVTAYDADEKIITVFNPASPEALQQYPVMQFIWAWEDSKYYMVSISEGQEGYVAHPIDVSDIELPDELHELQEAIAENVHEIWAENRQHEGWTYGEQRDDVNLTTPDMVPYSQLKDSEKVYDRDTAMNTLKLIHKLGYEIVKR